MPRALVLVVNSMPVDMARVALGHDAVARKDVAKFDTHAITGGSEWVQMSMSPYLSFAGP
ncbi:hypothetical protein C8N42_109134 [Celeribacter persicus]|uniref:Uncharacterized protein n=1 Tax=Celeribacter persicus TaxID=1651082 RepID=A0A2T5HGV8_9RHOB|nr:hypothetical protein C8N42_109134 [Celeribacter persicus]